ELEVLGRGELAIHERLVTEEAHVGALGVDPELAFGGDRQAGADPQERRLPGAVRACDEQEAAGGQLQVESTEDTLLAVALPEPASADHSCERSARSRRILAQPTHGER